MDSTASMDHDAWERRGQAHRSCGALDMHVIRQASECMVGKLGRIHPGGQADGEKRSSQVEKKIVLDARPRSMGLDERKKKRT